MIFLKDRKAASAVGEMESLGKQLVFLAQSPKDSDSARWFSKQSLRNTDLLNETKVPLNDAN